MKSIPKFDFDKKFQAKLVRALYQFPDEGREILRHVEPTMFDTAPMRWAVSKLRDSFRTTGGPASDTMLEYEAQRDVQLGLIKSAHIGAYAKFITGLDRRVPDKTFILDKAHEYVRFVVLRDFVIETAEGLQDPSKLNWSSINRKLDFQRSFGERSDGDLGQDYFDDVDARIERRETFEKNGVPTGTPVDEHMRHGGLPPKQLGVIIAPPGRGKTTALVWIGGSAIKAGIDVLHITLELEEDIIGERYDARFSGVSLPSLTSQKDKVRQRLQLVAAKYKAHLRIKEFPTGKLTVSGLRAYLKRLEAGAFYPGLIIIDYADIMSLSEYSGSSDSEHGSLGRLYVDLRGVAGEHVVPVWTASQSNRMSLDEEDIGIKDLAASFKKAEVADVMVGIGQTPDEQVNKVARLIMAKNRNGPTGKIDTITFDTRRVRISDL